MTTFRKRLLGIAVLVAVVFGILALSSSGSPCERLARDRDDASAVAGTYQRETEMFFYAASKVADITAEMRAQGCNVR